MNGEDIKLIYRRYAGGFAMIAQGCVSTDAARLALWLALHEVLERMPQQHTADVKMLGNWLLANGEHIADNPVETAISIIQRDTAVIAQLNQQVDALTQQLDALTQQLGQ